ncbi:MAG: GGDEF domain-containing protein [Deltaproteobacteria bacterium]|nr:GGDEF domain-containing protein [Deltaproteobacteria bacterium]
MADERDRTSSPEPLPGSVTTTSSGARVRLPGVEATMQIQDGSKLKEELAAALKESVRPVLVVMGGVDVGKRIAIAGTVVLGRDPGCDVVLNDGGVSWRHARIEDRGDAWGVVDLGSTNGTVVRGQQARDTILAAGDTVMLGRTVLRFELRDKLEQALDQELQRMLDVDDLSGLFVRRKFDRELETMIQTARSFGGCVGMLCMDMDGVKQINDTHGHLFGAYAIGETGRVIGRVLAGRGIASRFGGDEFVAAVPGLDTPRTAQVGTEILQAVNAHPYAKDGIPLHPGISIGVASFPADAGEPVTLFTCADKALYRAKQSGKNRVCL